MKELRDKENVQIKDIIHTLSLVQMKSNSAITKEKQGISLPLAYQVLTESPKIPKEIDVKSNQMYRLLISLLTMDNWELINDYLLYLAPYEPISVREVSDGLALRASIVIQFLFNQLMGIHKTVDNPYNIPIAHSFDDLSTLLFPILYHLGPYLHFNIILFFKVLRVLKDYLRLVLFLSFPLFPLFSPSFSSPSPFLSFLHTSFIQFCTLLLSFHSTFLFSATLYSDIFSHSLFGDFPPNDFPFLFPFPYRSLFCEREREFNEI